MGCPQRQLSPLTCPWSLLLLVQPSPASSFRPFTAFTCVCAGNGATALQSGILHGCARQKMGALVNGIANYGFGLPAMLLLAFYFREGAAGLWWGITASTFLQAAILQTLITRFDWQAEAERAARLVHHLSSGHLLTAAFSGELVAAHSAEAVAPLRVRGL